jgi:hypothetical protein
MKTLTGKSMRVGGDARLMPGNVRRYATTASTSASLIER